MTATNDERLCEKFGMTLEDVEREVSAVEAGDLSAWDFSRATMGRPVVEEKMDAISLKVPHSRLAAIDRAAKKQGMTRSEFVRRAIDRELMATA